MNVREAPPFSKGTIAKRKSGAIVADCAYGPDCWSSATCSTATWSRAARAMRASGNPGLPWVCLTRYDADPGREGLFIVSRSPLLCLVHVPKTGGTALLGTLNAILGRDKVYWIAHDQPRSDRENSGSEDFDHYSPNPVWHLRLPPFPLDRSFPSQQQELCAFALRQVVAAP